MYTEDHVSLLKGTLLWLALFFAVLVCVDQVDNFLYAHYAERLIDQIGGLECKFPEPEAPAESQKQFFFSASL